MSRTTADVKPRRRYDATKRRAQASDARNRMLTAAQARFLRDGYPATTVAAIADDAGVSVDTVYKTFGGKPGVVRAIVARALEGSAATPAEQRSDALHGSGRTGREIIEAWGGFVAEVAPLVAPVMLLMRDAATGDPEVRALLDGIDDDRRRRMTVNARRLRNAGFLRPDVSVAHAADIMWSYSSAEMYELFVIRRGWSAKRYGRFVAGAMSAALLEPSSISGP